MLTCHQLLQLYPQAWHAATVHPFLSACKTGQIHDYQFNTWLVQDYLFVIDFTRMTGRLLAAAPVHHFDLILGGMTALRAELNWFRDKADERHLDLQAPKQPTCEEYCRFMHQLATAPYPVQATAFWAIEYAYNQGWQLPGAMCPPYDEFAYRWGNPDFTDYVQGLAQQADEELRSAPEAVQQQAAAAFLEVARLEQAFWQMAYATPT